MTGPLRLEGPAGWSYGVIEQRAEVGHVPCKPIKARLGPQGKYTSRGNIHFDRGRLPGWVALLAANRYASVTGNLVTIGGTADAGSLI